MGKVSTTSRNWPDNNTTSASGVNSIYSDIQTQTGVIDSGNVRTEGIDTRNLVANQHVKWAGTQHNGCEFALGLSPYPAGAQYGDYATDGVRETPINHNQTGISSTVPGVGTKMQVNGTSGIALVANDIVRIKWTVCLWKVRERVNSSAAVAQLNMHASDLITTVARADGSTDGSGVGEWCFLVYPKINVSSNALTDADFLTVSGANMYYAAVADPKTIVPGLGNGELINAKFPHVSVVPMCILAQGTSDDDPGYTTYATGDSNATSGIRRPLTISGCITLRANANMTLYGIQLYSSGCWRMNAQGTPLANASLYLEDQECNGALGTPKYGVSQSPVYESASVSAMIMTNVYTT